MAREWNVRLVVETEDWEDLNEWPSLALALAMGIMQLRRQEGDDSGPQGVRLVGVDEIEWEED